MTTPPPYGSTPGQPQGYPGQPAQGYPQGSPTGPYQQPVYGQQPAYPAAPGYPAPGYGAPGFGAPTNARPGMVTAAAVLAFIWGGFAIIASLIGLAAGSLISSASNALCTSTDVSVANACNQVSSASGFLIFVTIALAVVAALLIWGGVVAITGKNAQIIVIACAVYAVLAIVQVIAGFGFGFSTILGLVAPVLIVVFTLNPASKAWFRSKGAKTF